MVEEVEIIKHEPDKDLHAEEKLRNWVNSIRFLKIKKTSKYKYITFYVFQNKDRDIIIVNTGDKIYKSKNGDCGIYYG